MAFEFLSDAVSPVAKEIGSRLADLISLAFTPIIKLKLKRDYNLELFKNELENKVSLIPLDKLTDAPPHIVGPVLEDVGKYYHNEAYLRTLFSNLIAASMNVDMNKLVHPSFKGIIEEITGDEAKLLKYLFKHPYLQNYRYPLVGIKFIPGTIKDDKAGAIIKRLLDGSISIIGCNKSIRAFDLGFTISNYMSLDGFNAGCEYPENFPQYLENLMRLKIVNVVIGKTLYHYEKEYTDIITSPYIDKIIINNFFAKQQRESYYGFPLNYYEITEFGKQFLNCCI